MTFKSSLLGHVSPDGWLTHNSKLIKTQQEYYILSSLYNVFLDSEYIASFENAVFGFSMFDPFRNIVWITNEIVGKSEEKSKLIKRLFDNSKYLPVTAKILRRLMIQNEEIETDNSRLMGEKWIDDPECIKIIKQKWIQTALKELNSGVLLDSIHVSHVYYMLSKIAEDSVRELLSKWLEKENDVEKIAKLIGRSGSDSTNGPYTQIDETTIAKLLNFELLKEKAKVELESGKNLTNFLKAVYLNITTGDKYYLNDANKGERW